MGLAVAARGQTTTVRALTGCLDAPCRAAHGLAADRVVDLPRGIRTATACPRFVVPTAAADERARAFRPHVLHRRRAVLHVAALLFGRAGITAADDRGAPAPHADRARDRGCGDSL